MVRLSKQTRDRSVCPRRPRRLSPNQLAAKTVAPANAYKAHPNALQGTDAEGAFIPKFNK